MSSQADATTDQGAGPAIEQGTYEVIRDRLAAHGATLAERANALNAQRLEIFGGTQTALSGTERVRTDNNCVPRDILAVHDKLLFGYNVFIGLKTETRVEDVFVLKRLGEADGLALEPVAPDAPDNFLADPGFLAEFRELYRFYKSARLQTLRTRNSKLLMVFQVGDRLDDVKVFRWALDPDGGVTWIDARGERDHTYPPAFDFEWTPTTRDDQVTGAHGHISILDEVFVETIEGDLTVKIEDNTSTGAGIYAEPVDDAHQSLDDGQFEYAKLGSLILLRILPYREEQWRHFVFNTVTQRVARIDNLGMACVQLPEDHGVIFPGGYYLQRGEHKTFEGDAEGMAFDRVVRSPNGEDVLYVFHRTDDGLYMLLPYNLIRKEVTTPLFCHGWCLFDDGGMVVFRRASGEPTRVHPMQVWTTPFVTDEFAARQPTGDSFLERVGNADLVRGISDCLSIYKMTTDQTPSAPLYEELIAATTRTRDAYYWLSEEAIGDLGAVLAAISDTAELIIDEFEKVQALQSQARERVATLGAEVETLFEDLRPDFWTRIDEFVDALGGLRRARGQLIATREVRYADVARLDQLDEQCSEHFDTIAAKAVAFLLEPEALRPYHVQISALDGRIDDAAKVTETKPLYEELERVAKGLELLTEVVAGLQIDDATVRTQILEAMSELMGSVNRTRALLDGRKQMLLRKEGVAEFGAQFALLSQSVASALALGDTPERCDEQLSKMMLQLEDLEGRFSEFDEFLETLQSKREEVYEAFGAKKQVLMDHRQRRAQNLMRAAERILGGVARRAQRFEEAVDLHAYFASDPMILKAQELSETLRELGDSVKADEVASKLKSARENAVRALRDRRDIFEDGQSVIRLGRHRFSVNTQELELTLVPRDGAMMFHLTGTGYYAPVDDPEFLATEPFWDQELVSEDKTVARAEYLAATVLFDAERAAGERTTADLQKAALTPDGLLGIVRGVAAERYDEGYSRGVHDVDATAILAELLSMVRAAGLLRYASAARAAAGIFWAFWADPQERPALERRAASLGRLSAAFERSGAVEAFQAELGECVARFYGQHELSLSDNDAALAGRYLFEQLRAPGDAFVASGEAARLVEGFGEHLRRTDTATLFGEELSALSGELKARVELATAWLLAWQAEQDEARYAPHAVAEAAWMLLTPEWPRQVVDTKAEVCVEGLLSQHARISGRVLTLRLDEFLGRLSHFVGEAVPGYRAYQQVRQRVLDRERKRLRLHEFVPRVLSSFVRNKLINDVYLPLFGDNMAKQLGALGAGKRTDLQGLLLLISPPGYGKTTLMEYISSRLGLVFMKINGPALGHGVHSLDPAEAPNATARQEVEKLNLAFEMGNNVLLYLDDIQHTHPELLQKFISLCDGQRRIEGVFRGETRTYDLRGKKFLVCMAGNPYTESGDKFQIPDMLANRADVYNLGDILGGQADTFALSYIENSLTSNAVLAPITTHEHADIYLLVRMAAGEEIALSELSYGYSRVEVDEILAVLRRLRRCQEVLLAVNQEYIRSASMDDAHRTEPPFKLQGSYRNMNKLAEKIAPVMNEAELEQLVSDHYLGEAQTLTTGAESNLLKLGELRGTLSPEEAARWGAIKEAFRRQQMMGGAEDDPATRVTGQLIRLVDQMGEIGLAIHGAAKVADQSAEREVAAQVEAIKVAAQLQAQAGAAMGQQLGARLAPYLQRLDGAIAAMKDLKVDVEVINTAPMAVHALLDKQIRVIEETLIPLVRAVGHNIQTDSSMWTKLSELVEELRQVDRRALTAPTGARKTVRPLQAQPPKDFSD